MFSDHSARRHTALWLIALILFGLITTLPFWNAKGDDVFIAFRYVRNFVDHGQLAFNLGEPTYGFTSPLWIFLLSGAYALIGDMYVAAWSLCLLSFIAFILILWALASRIIDAPILRATAIGLVLIDPWFMRWAFAGHEITFKISVVAALLWVTAVVVYGPPRRQLHYLGVGALFALSIMTRPEIGLLFLIACCAIARFHNVKGAVLVFLAGVLCYGVWALFCWSRFGYFLPHTILVRTGLEEGLLGRAGRILTWSVPRYVAIVGLPAAGVVLSACIIALRHRSVFRHLKEPVLFLLLLLWIVGVTCGYFLSSAYMASMYTLILSPFIPLAGFALLEAAKRAVPGPLAPRLIALSIAVTVVASGSILAARLGSFSWIVTDNETGLGQG